MRVSGVRWGGAIAVGVLGAATVLLAAPGTRFVPGAEPSAPGWLLGVYGDGIGVSHDAYLAALYTALAASIVIALQAEALGRRTVRIVIAVAVTAFALAPPLHSLDVFSYIAYGRLGLEGLNPYSHAPVDLPLDEAATRVRDYRDATSVYGPGFTLLSYPLAALGVPAALWSLKALAAASVLALAALVDRLATARGLSGERAAALVALNPITLVHIVGGAHNDGLMMAAVVGMALLLSRWREALAGWALVGATAIKATAALVAPFALIGTRHRGRLIAGIAVAVALLAIVTLVAFGGEAFDAIASLGSNQSQVSHRGIPATLSRATGIDVDAVRALLGAAYLAFVVFLLAWTARGGDWLLAAGWASLGLLVASSYLTPWYVLWALPLAAVTADRRLIVAVLALAAYQLPVGVS